VIYVGITGVLEMGETYWISTYAFTIGVDVENGIIKTIPPILKVFRGQQFLTLQTWLNKQFRNQVEIIKVENKL
jgi:hypothetical protein